MDPCMNPTFVSKYKIVDKLGEGSFSDVLKCEDKRTGQHYAAKRLRKVFKNAYEVINSAEVIAMNKLARHPNIIYMVEFHYDPVFGKAIFIFELMDMSMYDFMKSRKRRIPETKVRNYLYQILKGIHYLHGHGLFHRDIKPENILVKMCNSFYESSFQGELIKLGDLGSIRGIYSKPPYTEYISTRWYRSPECLLTTGHYGSKMDIWATGCVFYEMLTLQPLFAGKDEIDQLAKIHEILGTPSDRTLNKFKKRSRNFSHFPKQKGVGLKSLTVKISDEAICVLELMVQYDPDLRTNVRRLLDHRFFNSLREQDLFFNTIYKDKHPPKDYSNKIITTNKGDYHLPPTYNIPCLRKKDHKSLSGTSSKGSKDKSSSRTTINLNTYRPVSKAQNYKLRSGRVPLVGQKQMKSWGVDPDILNPKTDKQHTHEHGLNKFKHGIKEQQKYSKTTSDLSHIKTNATKLKDKQFQSKSFVIPSSIEQSKMKHSITCPHKFEQPIKAKAVK